MLTGKAYSVSAVNYEYLLWRLSCRKVGSIPNIITQIAIGWTVPGREKTLHTNLAFIGFGWHF